MELLNRFLGMVKLEKKPYQEASKETFSTAAMNFLLAAAASALGAFFLTWDVFGLVGSLVVGWIGLVVMFAIGVLIVWGLARLFGGKANYGEHYMSASYLSLWIVPSIIPIIGPFISMIGGLWAIVMHVVLTQNIHKITTGKAAAAVLIPYVLFAIIGFILAVVAATLLAGLLGGMFMGMPVA